jgi:hypothetical protein
MAASSVALKVYFVDSETQALEFACLLPKGPATIATFISLSLAGWRMKTVQGHPTSRKSCHVSVTKAATWESPLIPCLQRVLGLGRRYLESPSEERLVL